MGYCGIDQVLRDVAGNFTLLHERITDMGILRRLRACEPWIKALLQKMWPGVGKMPGNLRFVVIDGSTVQSPGADGTEYRLHVMMNLLTLEILHIEVTDAKQGECLDRYPLQDGDVVIADRGYNQPARIRELAKQGVLVVIRLNPRAMPLYKRYGSQPEKLDLYRHLKESSADRLRIPVWLGEGENALEGWVYAQRLPEAQARAARRKCRQSAKNGTPGRETLLFCEWRLIFTTLPQDLPDSAAVFLLYELRWQVELLIKRLKSLLNIDALRAKKGSELAGVWLHGKLLYALIIEKRARRDFGEAWTTLERQRTMTCWRVWKMLNIELTEVIAGTNFWRTENRADCLQVMQERPRRRKLQTFNDGLLKLLTTCRKLKVCAE